VASGGLKSPSTVSIPGVGMLSLIQAPHVIPPYSPAESSFKKLEYVFFHVSINRV
jgi:hypothetical protein